MNLFNRSARLAQIRQQQSDAAPALGQLQGGVDAPGDGLHIVLQAHQEARNHLSTSFLSGVEESGGGGLVASRNDFFHDVHGQLFIAACQVQRHHAYAIFETFQVTLAVKRL